MNRLRRWPWLLVVKILVAIGIVGWLTTGPLDVRLLWNLRLSTEFVVLVSMLLAAMWLPAVRWWLLLRIQRIEVSLWQVTQMTWVGYLTGMILPGAVSGDVAKGYLILRDRPASRARSLSTVLVDRFIGVYSLVLLGCVSAGWFLLAEQPSDAMRVTCWMLALMLAGLTLSVAGLTLRPVRQLLGRFAPATWVEALGESYQLYGQSKRTLLICLILSLASSGLTAASLAAADRVLGGHVDWTASLVVGPLIVLANSVPITPGGIGVAEAAASGLFGQAGSANGAEMMLAIRLVMAILSLPALLILFGRQRDRINLPPRSAGDAVQDAPAAGKQRGGRQAA